MVGLLTGLLVPEAIDLLLAASEIRELREAPVVRPTPYETRGLTDPDDAASARMSKSVR